MDDKRTSGPDHSNACSVSVEWRGARVCHFSQCESDHSWLFGTFDSAGTLEARAFFDLVETLPHRDVLADPSLGTRVILHEEGIQTHALVIGLTDEQDLWVRRVYHPESVAWLIENIQ